MKRLLTLGVIIAAAALTAAGQITITNMSLPPAVLGKPYAPVTLSISGDNGPIVWSVISGNSLPPGFVIGPPAIGQPATDETFCYGFLLPAGGPPDCTGNVQAGPGIYPFVIQALSLGTQKTATQEYLFVVLGPPQILTPPLLTNGIANQAYAPVQLQASGGSGQFAWSVTAGTLPQGIQLDTTKGVLAGTAPGVSGSYVFTVQVLDQVSQLTAQQTFTINVVGGLAITTTALPNAILNQPYQFQLTGTAQNPVWSVPPGSQLPAGFSLSTSGLLTGVGLVLAPSLSVPVQLADAEAPAVVATHTFTLTVTLGQLTINQTTLPGATQNIPYTATLTASGGIPPYAWSFSTSIPPGLTGASTGVISGTPTTAGSFPMVVTVQDSNKTVVQQNLTINVGNPVSITTTSLPTGSPNVPYSATLTATGGVLTYRWSVIAGNLPPGLTLDSARGQISGTPTTQGAFQFTAQITDFLGGTATMVFTITIGASQPLTILTVSSLPGGSLNQPYSRTLSAIGGTQPVVAWAIIGGSLPAGLSLNRSTGEVSGTPTVLGSSSFTVQATDSANQTATRNLTLVIATPVTASANSFTASVGAAVSQSVTAAGGIPPYAFFVNSGSLPLGLNLDANTGLISGTPTAAGTFPVTIFVSDIDARNTTTSIITITVNSLPLTIVVPASPGSGQQPGIGVSIPAPASGDISGTLALAFTSSVGGTDNMIVFQNGSRSITFTITKGNTTAPNATVITGTVAGTITLIASVPGSPDVIKTIVIAPAVPVISSVALQQVTGGLNVVVSGYSNTREVSSGSFTFTVSSGNTLSQATITVPLTSAYTTWFNNTSSNATGGQFKLTVPFSVTQGSATAVTKVSVTLTNGQGASAAVSSP